MYSDSDGIGRMIFQGHGDVGGLESPRMEMAATEASHLRRHGLVSLISACFLVASSYASPHPDARLLGVHPLDEKFYAAEVIKCRDGSKSFTKDHLNDDFCDCFDGTDEPGTSACPAAKFYCRNVGSTPKFIYSSRVNDYFCDCCDGSDEYDGSLKCPNTCIMGGNVEYKAENYATTTTISGVDNKEPKNGMNIDELIQKLKGASHQLSVDFPSFTSAQQTKKETHSLIYLTIWSLMISRFSL